VKTDAIVAMPVPAFRGRIERIFLHLNKTLLARLGSDLVPPAVKPH